MMAYNWTCPHCEHDVTITTTRQSQSQHTLRIANQIGRVTLSSLFRVCPNPECEKFTLEVDLHESGTDRMGQAEILGALIKRWQLYPEGAAKVFPDYIPAVILADYVQSCLIRDLSPKASATLSRRCLQGIIRDFWAATPGRLVDEIRQIKDRVDPDTWAAIDAVRKIGNVGAHMENDIDVIVEVDPGEATLLIELVETLLKEWYVARHSRQERMAAIVASAAEKDLQKKGGSNP